MATGYTAIFIAPAADVLQIPQDWNTDYPSDVFEERIKYADNEPDFTVFDHQPDQSEIDAACALYPGGTAAELIQINNGWHLRVRYPVTYTAENRGGIAPVYELSDSKLPASWGRKAVFWWVNSTANKLKLLHTHLYTTLGFGPVAGALAALDPADQSRFLDKAVQTATGLTNAQQLARVTTMRNVLVGLGYAGTNLSAIIDAPAGKTEDDLIRALVSDLGFTMQQLFKTTIRMD